MPSSGYIQVHAFASNAQIPLENVTVAVTATDGTALAMRLTDRSGKISQIEVPTPSITESQSPQNTQIPFTPVNLYARLRGYKQIEIEDLQVFADTVTWQDLEMIPVSELPETWDKAEIFNTPPQNL